MGRSPSNNILDEHGEEKYLEPSIMEPKHLSDFKKELDKWRSDEHLLEKEQRGAELWRRDINATKPDFNKINDLYSRMENMPDVIKVYLQYTAMHPRRKIQDTTEIAEYMGVRPFNDCVMMNVSPNWKGMFGSGDGLQDTMMIDCFKKTIEGFINKETGNLPRWTRYKYCLECGKEGNHLHAHIVLEANPKNKKSILGGKGSYWGKGNFRNDFIIEWKRNFPKGYHRALKGNATDIQGIILRKRELVEDKLKYLVEDTKPSEHQNEWDLEEVHGTF